MAHYKAPQYRRKGSRFGEQRWCSGESTRPPPMWPGFDSQTRRHMWVEFVGSLLCSERFFLNYSSFPLSSKTYIWLESPIKVVSFAAVIRVIMQCSSPLTAAHSSSASLSLNWPIRSRLTVACMLLVPSNNGKGMQSPSEQPLVGRSITWRP